MEGAISVRSLKLEDIDCLREIDTGFTSEAILRVDRMPQGLGACWHLREVTVDPPLEKPSGYDFTEEDLAGIRRRLREGQSMQLVAEDAGRLVGFLEVEDQPWNRTAMIWNILIDRAYRRRGLGRHFVKRAMEWARQRDRRALMLETQNNNINACRFYQRMGLRLTGVRDDLYHNDDLQRGEVAIFWSLVLDASTLDRSPCEA